MKSIYLIFCFLMVLSPLAAEQNTVQQCLTWNESFETDYGIFECTFTKVNQMSCDESTHKTSSAVGYCIKSLYGSLVFELEKDASGSFSVTITQPTSEEDATLKRLSLYRSESSNDQKVIGCYYVARQVQSGDGSFANTVEPYDFNQSALAAFITFIEAAEALVSKVKVVGDQELQLEECCKFRKNWDKSNITLFMKHSLAGGVDQYANLAPVDVE